MPGKLVQTGASGVCTHGGTIIYKGTSSRVMLSTMPAITASDIQTVVACPLKHLRQAAALRHRIGLCAGDEGIHRR